MSPAKSVGRGRSLTYSMAKTPCYYERQGARYECLVRMRKIPLSRGYGYAIVDDEDFDSLSLFNWHLSTDGYAERTERHGRGVRESIFMHRVVAGTPRGMCTDHINGNTLDNRKENLRICTKAQNNFGRRSHKNKVGGVTYRGVHLRYGTRYVAAIKFGGKYHHISSHDTAEDAAIVYNVAAQLFFGEFAALNDV